MQYDDICEVFTDKLVAKIPSTHDGVIKSIKFKNDDIAPVGSAIVEIEVEDDQTKESTTKSMAAPQQEQKKGEDISSSLDESKRVPHATLSSEVSKSNDKALATPAVRSIAKRHGIDISNVAATGKEGRVLKEDILAYIDGKTKPQVVCPTAAAKQASASTGSHIVKIAPLTGVRPEDQIKKLTGMKKAMTKTMTESASIPSFTFTDEIDVTELMKLRQILKKNKKNTKFFCAM